MVTISSKLKAPAPIQLSSRWRIRAEMKQFRHYLRFADRTSSKRGRL